MLHEDVYFYHDLHIAELTGRDGERAKLARVLTALQEAGGFGPHTKTAHDLIDGIAESMGLKKREEIVYDA